MSTYHLDFSWLGENLPRLIGGAALSLKLMLFTAVASFVIGLIAGQMRMAKNPLLRFLATAYIDFFRTTPLLVQVVFFFFCCPSFSASAPMHLQPDASPSA